MKFLVDECLGYSVTKWLQSHGYDVVSIVEVSPGISDDQVLHKALLENRILITMDKDFGDIVFRSNKDHCGIILLRLVDDQLSRKITILSNVLTQHAHELENNFIVVTDQSIRIVRMDKWH